MIRYPLVRLHPFSPRLGQIDADDLRTLQKMTPEDLVVLGRVVSSGRIVAQSSELKLVRDLVDTFARLGIDLDRYGMITVQSKAGELGASEFEAKKAGEKDITALAEISRILVEKRPDWQVTYRKANRDIQIVASRTGEASEKVSLDPPDRSVGGALKYIRDHKDILEKMKRAAALGNPGWFIPLVGILIGLALIFIGVLLELDSKKRQWERVLIDRIASNEAQIEANNRALQTLKPGDPAREMLMKENDRLEAENVELRKALVKSQEAQTAITEIINALGIAPVVQAIVALSGIILVFGLALWVLDPTTRKPEPQPAKS